MFFSTPLVNSPLVAPTRPREPLSAFVAVPVLVPSAVLPLLPRMFLAVAPVVGLPFPELTGLRPSVGAG